MFSFANIYKVLIKLKQIDWLDNILLDSVYVCVFSLTIQRHLENVQFIPTNYCIFSSNTCTFQFDETKRNFNLISFSNHQSSSPAIFQHATFQLLPKTTNNNNCLTKILLHTQKRERSWMNPRIFNKLGQFLARNI